MAHAKYRSIQWFGLQQANKRTYIQASFIYIKIVLNLPRPPRPAPRPVYGSDGRRRPELHFSWLRDPSSSDLASVAENLVGTFVNCPTDVRGGRVAEENLIAFYYASDEGGFGSTGVEPFTSFEMR